MDVRKLALTLALAITPALGRAQEPGRVRQAPMHPGPMAGMGAMKMSMMDSMMAPMMQAMDGAHWAMTRGAGLTAAQQHQVRAMADSMTRDCQRMHARGGMRPQPRD